MTNRPVLDPYAILGVPRDATALQVARAHRRLAKRFHPDLHPGEDLSEHMRRINEAWRILSSTSRRTEYDGARAATGTAASGHWAGSRREFHAAPPTTTRTWATWRATAAETRAAPPTRRRPGEQAVPATRRPPRIMSAERSFRDSGWAALLAAIVFLLILAAAIVAQRLG
jgi:curved DNA-binding protein CbpA